MVTKFWKTWTGILFIGMISLICLSPIIGGFVHFLGDTDLQISKVYLIRENGDSNPAANGRFLKITHFTESGDPCGALLVSHTSSSPAVTEFDFCANRGSLVDTADSITQFSLEQLNFTADPEGLSTSLDQEGITISLHPTAFVDVAGNLLFATDPSVFPVNTGIAPTIVTTQKQMHMPVLRIDRGDTTVCESAWIDTCFSPEDLVYYLPDGRVLQFAEVWASAQEEYNEFFE